MSETAGRRYEVFIPQWRPLLLRELLYKNPFVARRKKKLDEDTIAGYFRQLDVPKAAGKRRVTLRIILKPRARESDDDNLFKCLLDGLKKCGQLVDDNRRYCETRPPDYERGTAQTWGTWIVLEDLASTPPTT